MGEMMLSFITMPLPGIILVIILAFIDYPLTAIAHSSHQKYMSRFVQYRASAAGQNRNFSFWDAVIKLSVAVFLYVIYAIYIGAELNIARVLYLWLLGFAIGSYFIVNLRHIESILLSRLYSRTDLVEGRISYQAKFSLKVSAVQFLSLFIIFALYAILVPSYFTLGLAFAPFFLIIRNLLLSH